MFTFDYYYIYVHIPNFHHAIQHPICWMIKICDAGYNRYPNWGHNRHKRPQTTQFSPVLYCISPKKPFSYSNLDHVALGISLTTNSLQSPLSRNNSHIHLLNQNTIFSTGHVAVIWVKKSPVKTLPRSQISDLKNLYWDMILKELNINGYSGWLMLLSIRNLMLRSIILES